MKKQTLLGAIALTTLAVGAAGAANAQQYTLVQSTVTGGTVAATTKVASELKLDGTVNKGALGLSVVPSALTKMPAGNSVLTLSLTGGHVFGAAVGPGAIVANGACAPATTVSSGGAATDSSVTFLLASDADCVTGLPITVALPVELKNTTTAVGVGSTLKTELGTNLDGGSATLSNAVTFGKAFSVTVVADTTATAATLSTGFKGLTNAPLGTITLAADAASKIGISTGTIATGAALTDVVGASFKFVGNQSAAAASLSVFETSGATNTAVPTATGVLADGTPSAAYTVNAVAGGTGLISASTYTVATDLTLATNFNAVGTFGPSALESITRQGTTYLIPWVGSGTSASATGNQTVIRISNIGTTATGAVSAELLNSSTGTGAIGSLIAINGTIAAGKDFVITGASLQSNFGGTDFGRGDVRITVEANAADLITRRFIQNVAGGSVSEVSLGRTAGGVEPQN